MKRFLAALALVAMTLPPVFSETGSPSAAGGPDDTRLDPLEATEDDSLGSEPADSDDEPRPIVPSNGGLVVGDIHIHRANVFESLDGRPLRFPYSWANKLHIVTRERFIRNDLLFRSGDPYDAELIQESERYLRGRPFFRYVQIEPQPAEEGRVDVVVRTTDVWTTSIRPTYRAAGGEYLYGMGVLENNFLGQGKQVGAFIEQDIDRLTRGASYKDRQLFGSRWQLGLGYGRDEKGRDWEAELSRPFYSYRVPWSLGGGVFVSDDDDRLFEDGDEVVTFFHEVESQRAFTSFAVNPRSQDARRWTLAYERQSDRFGDVRAVVPPPVFDDRVVSAVLLGFDYRDNRFRTWRGVMTFDRDEDINLGWEWLLEAGPSLESLGATRDGAFGRGQAQKVLALGESSLWFNHLDVEGRYERGAVYDGVTRLRSEFFWLEWIDKHTASLRAEYAVSRRLDPEEQFLLGGDNGLRGYEVRKFAGQNSFIATLENRRVVLYDWLQLVNIGWAVFADAGTVWKTGESLAMKNMKSDVGVGIRFAPTRSVDASLIRADIAYALQDNDRTSRLVLNIGADIHFGERSPRKFEQ